MSPGSVPTGSCCRSLPGWKPPPHPSRPAGAGDRAGTGSPRRHGRLTGRHPRERLTARSADLDGLTAGHGLGARLTHAFLSAEGDLVSNGERLPARDMKEKFDTSSLESSMSLGELTDSTRAHGSLAPHAAYLTLYQVNSSAVHNARQTEATRLGPGPEEGAHLGHFDDFTTGQILQPS